MHGVMMCSLSLVLSSCVLHSIFVNSLQEVQDATTFRAAVYEHAVTLAPSGKILSRREAVKVMNQNLNVYKVQAQKAAKQGAQIIVFPEDGIYGIRFTRQSVEPFLEYIPDPQRVSWVPCDDPRRYSPSDVLQSLSCMAKENNIFLVANMGDRQPCDRSSDTKCLSGHYQYNTDVAFDSTGKLVARYHKVTLYYEFQFDSGKPEAITFQTPFGTFGLITCFDFLFGNPVVPLIQGKMIGNVIGPTAWMDVLPLLAAVEFHSSFAVGLGINFLTANLHIPSGRFQGSGIYTPTGPAVYYYNQTQGAGKLLIADIKSLTKPNLVPKSVFLTKQSIIPPTDETSTVFMSAMWHDVYSFVPLQKSAGLLTVCQNKLCCSLKYSMTPDSRDLYAFGAFDGRHAYKDNAYYNYLQVCALVRCAGLSQSSCGNATRDANTIFQEIEITGNFSTSFVFPEMLLTNGSSLRLAPGHFSYQNGSFGSKNVLPDPLITASMFGRVYEKDDPSSDLIG